MHFKWNQLFCLGVSEPFAHQALKVSKSDKFHCISGQKKRSVWIDEERNRGQRAPLTARRWKAMVVNIPKVWDCIQVESCFKRDSLLDFRALLVINFWGKNVTTQYRWKLFHRWPRVSQSIRMARCLFLSVPSLEYTAHLYQGVRKYWKIKTRFFFQWEKQCTKKTAKVQTVHFYITARLAQCHQLSGSSGAEILCFLESTMAAGVEIDSSTR